ncbi:FAD-dependent oxidoreductase [Jiangella asiatica]|uniref:FAD-dependent oxidoreductase n=1 Tax=Jiangella asiatica TaxID=2530372 RepID=A0A4R5D7A2_9ACTN|nr:FAD-dependent oxidoreductase [Jiangella asiatica]TDE09286.1 FAD-dependent oxidoreductase [Jiangella asiatica]
MTTGEDHRMIDLTSALDADVVVAGAGSAGVAAAVAAAESGARTVLVEASGHVGGTLAWQLLEHSAGFHDVRGNQVVGGVGQRIVDRLRQYGGTPGHIADDVGYTATRTPVNHAELAMAEATLLADAGVQVLLNCPVVAAVTDGRRVRGLDIETPDGRRHVTAPVFVDASGDAVLATLAGATVHDDVPHRQPASLLLKLGGVDFAALLAYAADHPDDLRPGNAVGSPDDECVNLWGFGRLLDAGHRQGLLELRRTELHLAGWPRRGEAVLNVTRVPWPGAGLDGGAAYLRLSKQVLEVVRWFRQLVPGGREAYLSAVADRLGVRESRRVVGLATLTRDDVVSGRRHPDSVATGAFPIDIHDASTPGLEHADTIASSYDIPFGCLVPRDLDNALVAGRCVSSTHEGNGSVRITGTCFATGEAAGVAAALVADGATTVAALDVPRLQDLLRRRGVLGARDGVTLQAAAPPRRPAASSA